MNVLEREPPQFNINRKRGGIKRELVGRVDMRMLRWFGQVERMEYQRTAGRVLMEEASERWVRGRPRFGCMNRMKVAIGSRGVTVLPAQ